MNNFCFKSNAIAFVGLIFISLPAIANPNPENSTDVLKPIKNEVREGIDKDRLEIPVQSKKPKVLEIADIVEVHPRTEMWQTIHSGDLNRGTVQFKFVTE